MDQPDAVTTAPDEAPAITPPLTAEQLAAKNARDAEIVRQNASPLDRALMKPLGSPNVEAPTLFDVRDALAVPSLSLQPGMITGLPDYEALQNPTLASAVSTMEALHKAAADVITARDTYRSDVTITQAAAVLATDAFHSKVQTPALQRVDASTKALDSAIASTEAELRKVITNGSSFAPEIRAFMRSLSVGERQSALNKAIEAQDVVTLSAVLNAPAYLSGLEPKMVPLLVTRANEVRNPNLTKQLALMRAARDRLQQAAGIFLKSTEQLTGTRDATVRRLRAQQAKVKTVIGSLAPV